MPIYQAYNDRIKAYVKYKYYNETARITDVKQRNPNTPFVGVPIRGNRRG